MNDEIDKENKAVWQTYIRDLFGLNQPEDNIDFEAALDNMEGAPHPVIKKAEQKRQENKPVISVQKDVQQVRSTEMDKRRFDQLRKGKIAIEATLDLHGLNQAQARAGLIRFVSTSYQQSKRCILVITGKGKSQKTSDEFFDSDKGVLKRQLPFWLNEPECKPYVLKHVQAVQKHGGGGAFYIYLRKKKA